MAKNCHVAHMTDNDLNGYYILANAIILQAVRDYKNCYTALLRNPKSSAARYEVKALRSFFLGGYFEALTDLSGKAILEHLEKELNYEYKRKLNRKYK